MSRRGHIVGVAAIAGNGQAALAEVLLGLGKLKRGTVHLDGVDVTHRSAGERLAAGLGVVAEDPVTQGGVGPMSVRENLMLTRGPFPGKGSVFLALRKVAHTAAAIAERSPFPMPALARQLETLSGGNVQRVVLVREMQRPLPVPPGLLPVPGAGRRLKPCRPAAARRPPR